MDRGNRTPLRYLPTLLLVVLGAIIGSCHSRSALRGVQDPATAITRTTVTPPANAFGNLTVWMQNQTGWLFRGKQLDSENRKLAERVAQLEGENTLLKDQAVRYEQLRNDLGFVKQSPKALLAADIIARRIDSKYETLLVARGTNDGVKVDSAVVTRNGLVGRVFETTATTAAVLMITDQKSGAGGRVLRANSRAIGVCKGDNSNTLTLTYLENDADIVAGDEIVTSGLGGIYPPGIRIGVVREVKVDPTSAIKTAKVVPAVVFDKLEEVYIQK